MSKLDKMIRFTPDFYRPSSNINVRGLLNAWAGEDDLVVQGVKDAKEQIFVKYALGTFLDTLGSNVGVFRPNEVGINDDQLRLLIPMLSFNPKIVRRIIWEILNFFFGENNSLVTVNEINPNEVVIEIPSTANSFFRQLKGSHHFHNYSGQITAIDNTLKTLTIDLDNPTYKTLALDELNEAVIGQHYIEADVLSNTAGNTGVTLQFSASTDLSVFAIGQFGMYLKNYPGSFLFNPTQPFTLTKRRTLTTEGVLAGDIKINFGLEDVSAFPDAAGCVIFDYGFATEEAVPYLGRPANMLLLIDPTYQFKYDHPIGTLVNFAVKPVVKPTIDGKDYSVYIVDTTEARKLAQKLIESVVAAGVLIRWIIK